ncbi:response regulator [Salinactinospora qingdaonensis]|uniref:Response regulator n=1 Tax=Salinactinospora qingdaonensis TaxID=702744 RepID=A0ABP7G0P3_9ACTN
MPRKANILLVDDREDNLTALEAILTSLDQNLVRASSGEAALKALLEGDFAVILLDVMMPGMDGFETAAHIKQREKTKDIPIIFLTGAGIDRHQVFRGYASRSIDYLTKPYDPWVLRSKVEVFVELYQTKRQLYEQSAQLRRQLGDDGNDSRTLSAIDHLVATTEEIDVEMGRLRQRLLDDERETDGHTMAIVRELGRSVSEMKTLVEALRGPE